jgi:hypothetical protein
VVDDRAADWLIEQSMDDVEGDEAADGNRVSAILAICNQGYLDDLHGFAGAADKW